MFLKLMSFEDVPDKDSNKPYKLVECRTVEFRRGVEGGNGWAVTDASDYHALEGNAYVLNSNGKTIESYWPSGKMMISAGSDA